MLGHPNLVGWYRAEGNGNDSSAQARTGTAVGLTYEAGIFGQRFVSDAVTGHYDALSSMPFSGYGTANLTVAFWVKSTNSTQAFYTEKNNAAGSLMSFIRTATIIQTVIQSADGSTRLQATCPHTANNTLDHIALVRTSTTTMQFYINGVAQTMTHVVSSAGSLGTLLYATIGANREAAEPSGNMCIIGTIEDVQLYKYALPAPDIKRIMMGLHPLTRS